MVTLHSFLAAGQRYALSGCAVWNVANQFTILAVGRDRRGVIWVTFRTPNGADQTQLAACFESAVAAGAIVPLATGPAAYC